MTHPGPSLQEQVDDLNEASEPIVGRLIKLRVQRVSIRVPPPSRIKNNPTLPRIVEIDRKNARILRDYFTARLEDRLPGTIEFMLYGLEELL